MRLKLFTTCLIAFLLIGNQAVIAQKTLLQSGPMVGYSEMKEVKLWAQTTESALVEIVYWDKTKPSMRYKTDAVRTQKADGFTAHLIADKVEPGIRYAYELLINGKVVTRPYPLEFQSQTLWQYRSDPPDFKIALGSCYFDVQTEYDRPGNPYGGEMNIFTSIHQKKPDLMIWLGDNFYYREADWYTTTGINQRNTNARSLPELQPLLGSTSQYAIWDDHDYGPNDSDRSFIHKDKTRKAFMDFWANPSYGLDNQGITTFFQWNDMHFFLLDNRWFRSPNNRITGTREIIGSRQFEWLLDALKTSQAPYKFVCIGGQFVNSEPVFENMATFGAERDALIAALTAENISGLVFLTGDRHHTELSVMTLKNGKKVVDFTSSPLTSGAATGVSARENNRFRVPGTLVEGKRNFGVIEVTGKRTERVLKFITYDSAGNEIWSKTYDGNELK